MDSYNYFLFVQFIRYFLLAFAVLLGVSSGYIFFNPQVYWKITSRSLKFKGIKGAKPTNRFYKWVQISTVVQIALSLAILFVLFFTT